MHLMVFRVPDKEDTYCATKQGAVQVQRYRGTYRDEPYPGDFPEEHELYKVLVELLHSKTSETDEIHDLNTAAKVVDLLARHVPDHSYEIVEVTLDDAKPEIGSRFIGYDISIHYHLSLVWRAFIAWSPEAEREPTNTDMPEDVQEVGPLIDVTIAYFSRSLNSDGLFATYADADLFLRCARLLNTLCSDNLFESKELMDEFEVTGLYEVRLK